MKLQNKQSGFTLVEIMIVLAILGAIMALVAPNVIDNQSKANVKIAKAQMANVKNALNMYKADNFVFPSTDQGLQALIEKPAGSPEPKNWTSPYMDKMPTDPWGAEFLYFKDGNAYELISLGADGQEGGEGEAADISSKDL